MKFIKTEIPDVYIIEPSVFGDDRGYFLESFNLEKFEENVYPIKFVQDNESKSSRGVLRGLHFQKPPFEQSKLVRCIEGSVMDVAVDIRKGSPTYGKHVAVELTGENKRQLFVPRGFAWLDTGTHDSLMEAGQFIETIEKRQGLKVACLEEIAYRMNYISKEQLKQLAEPLKKNGYGQYLLKLAK